MLTWCTFSDYHWGSTATGLVAAAGGAWEKGIVGGISGLGVWRSTELDPTAKTDIRGSRLIKN